MDIQQIYPKGLSEEERILVLMVRTAEKFKRESTALFSKSGLSFSQYTALRVLESAPEGQATITEISRWMLVSGPNLSGITKRLEKGKFVQRLGHPDDERKKIIKITDKGRRVLAEIKNDQEAIVQGFFPSYSAERKNILHKNLRGMLRD